MTMSVARRLGRALLHGATLIGFMLPSVASAQEARPGRPAPEMDLPMLGGGRVRLSTLKGHPVILTFWGTWCPPCRDEFPALSAMYTQYRDSGLVVIAVNQRDQELNTKAVEEFVREFSVPFIVALDERGRTRRNFRLVGLPTTIFIDTAGVIRVVHPGPITPGQLEGGLARILAVRR